VEGDAQGRLNLEKNGKLRVLGVLVKEEEEAQ